MRLGNVWSPLFFIIVLAVILWYIDMMESRFEHAGRKRLTNLKYADEVCLLARHMEEMQGMVDTIGTKIS